MYVLLRSLTSCVYPILICEIKGLPVHHTSVSLRGYLCTSYVCVIKGLPVHHTSVSLRDFYFSRSGDVIHPML